MTVSSYYRARISKKDCSFFTAVLRSYEHMAFDRTFDVPTSTFEFFVPEGYESSFEELMHFFAEEGIVHDLQKLPNRLLDPEQLV